MYRNKKRLIPWILFLMILFCLTGCSKEEKETKTGYKVYYVDASGTKLVEQMYDPTARTFEEMMEELMGQLKVAPANTAFTSALTKNVKYNGYEPGIDALRVDFSEEYSNLTNIEEVLLRAAVVKTLSQIPGVTKVLLTVDHEPLRDADGNIVKAMDANSFIDTQGDGINSYLYATLLLYFTDETGRNLIENVRNLHYSSNMVLERVVVEQLIEGPEKGKGGAIFTKNVKILSLYIQDGICTINFDEEANRLPSDKELDPEAVLYAVTNSICRTCDNITGVKFEIDGDSDALFRDQIKLNQIFTENQSYTIANRMQVEEG